MNYIIGAGAILETGENATITPATLHARVDAALAQRVVVAAVDFDGTAESALRRLLILTQGWNSARFRAEVTEPLRRRGDCTLADVLETLAKGAGTGEVHLFSHWMPAEETCRALGRNGIELVAHPLESIEAASLIAGQKHRRWHAA
ncbi:MAG TPA: hypothetical protein VGZ02_13940 [Candidatus Baltobacteraceae bacterium]|jgi:hypothetical protein|nr:hypothetical protein [Candidatus Baltobacteraceae bacterium]